MADPKQISNKKVTLVTSTKVEKNKYTTFVNIEGINLPPAKQRQAGSNQKVEDGREKPENEIMGHFLAKVARHLGRRYRTAPSRGGNASAGPAAPPPLRSAPPPKVPLPNRAAVRTGDGPNGKQGGHAGKKRTLEAMSESAQAQQTLMEADRQRRQKPKTRRCRCCKTVVQYPDTVDKAIEKTRWEIHLASQGHKQAMVRYGREWNRKCDVCDKSFRSFEDGTYTSTPRSIVML